jgi:hypothetical protein
MKTIRCFSGGCVYRTGIALNEEKPQSLENCFLFLLSLEMPSLENKA